MTSRVPIKHLFDISRRMVMPADFGAESLFHYSLPAWHVHGDGIVENAAELASGKLLLNGDEVLVSKLNPEKSAVLLTEPHDIPTVCSPEFIALVPRAIDRRFAFFFMLSAPLRHQLNASVESVTNSHKRARVDRFLASKVELPDADTQKAIADFLDRETARIDQLIEKKQRLVELLRERSLSAIEKAVTADSSLSKLGHHVKILPGYAFASASFSDNDDDIRLLRGANVAPGKIRWDDVVYWPRDAIGGLDRFQLEVGDIVMGMDRPWISGGIRVAEITKRDVPALLLQRVCKIIPLKTLSKEFLKILLSSKKFLGYFEPELTGVSVPHISGDQIAGFRFPYVPVPQQDERAKVCTKILASNDGIVDRAQQSIARLQEFRSALITAAVTGQIDVATWGKQGQTDRRLDEIEEAMQA